MAHIKFSLVMSNSQNYSQVLNGLLQTAGNKLQTKLFLDKNGVCVIKKDHEDSQYIVELPKNSEIVYFYSPICKVPFDCSEEFFERILEKNLCGIAYNQATFGLDAKTQNIVITYTRSMRLLDDVTFFNILCNFITTADRAKNDLCQLKNNLLEETHLTEADVDNELSAYTSSTNNKIKA